MQDFLDIIQSIIQGVWETIKSLISGWLTWDTVDLLISKVIEFVRSMVQDYSKLGAAVFVTGVLWVFSSTLAKIFKILFFTLLLLAILLLAYRYIYG